MKFIGLFIFVWLIVLFGFLFPWAAADDVRLLACYLLVVATGLGVSVWGDALWRSRRLA
jgi:hypothetical protein